MVRRLFIVAVMLFGLVGFSMAAKINTKLFKETYQYDLKNLEADLKKDINIENSQKNCQEMRCGLIPNNYQVKGTDDQIIRQFIVALKTKKYKKAAELFNGYILSGGEVQDGKDLLPSPYPINYGRSYLGFIPYADGLLGISSEGQDFTAKYVYITIKDNVVYRVKTNSALGIAFENNNVIAIDGETGKNKFNLPVKNIETNTKNNGGYNEKNRQKTYQRMFNYLQGKEKSKELDERKNAFKVKVKKLFK